MIHLLPFDLNSILSSGFGCFLSLIMTFILLSFFRKFLPSDRGRAYASQSDISIGKPTGAGLYFILSILVSAVIFLPLDVYSVLLYSVVLLAMLFGFWDDASKKPWHEYFKGALDLLVSFSAALVFELYIGSAIYVPLSGRFILLPALVFVPLATLLIWVSINVTNCTDGVDGLASSLSIISLLAFFTFGFITAAPFFKLGHIAGPLSNWHWFIPIVVGALLAYLWFNTNPSMLLMGDAGSRGLGVILALSALFTRNPLSYLFICLIFIVDGGAGIAKISLKRFLKISILKNVKTPIHDHLRDSGVEEDTHPQKMKNQTLTVRFSLISIVICSLYMFAEVFALQISGALHILY
ncbi:MAG: phospho-N-acetylmuramoyl-pentapeptide-transferase [Clostridiales bacterium]|nr:phospho-N-acetylmuramoyl-pentapeptide-transferase [Clostridiales bacterium]